MKTDSFQLKNVNTFYTLPLKRFRINLSICVFALAQTFYFTTEGSDINKLCLSEQMNNFSLFDSTKVDMVIKAIDERDKELFHYLLNQGIDIDLVGSKGWTALGFAAAEGKYYFADALLDNGANINIPVNNYRTPYLAAAAEGHLKLVKLLEERGAEKSAMVGNKTSIALAASEGHFDVVQYFLETNKNIVNADQIERAFLLAAKEGYVGLVELFIKKMQVNTNIKLMNKALRSAIVEGRLSVVKLLMEKGADITCISPKGTTTLSLAAKENHIKILNHLIYNGINPNLANHEGWTALHFAAVEGHVEIMQLLIENKATIDMPINTEWVNMGRNKGSKIIMADWTALMLAIEENQLDAVNLLLKSGADINIAVGKSFYSIQRIDDQEISTDKDPLYETTGWTPLMEAVENQNEKIVKLLLEYGAIMDVKTKEGMSAIILAERKGNQQIIDLLK